MTSTLHNVDLGCLKWPDHQHVRHHQQLDARNDDSQCGSPEFFEQNKQGGKSNALGHEHHAEKPAFGVVFDSAEELSQVMLALVVDARMSFVDLQQTKNENSDQNARINEAEYKGHRVDERARVHVIDFAHNRQQREQVCFQHQSDVHCERQKLEYFGRQFSTLVCFFETVRKFVNREIANMQERDEADQTQQFDLVDDSAARSHSNPRQILFILIVVQPLRNGRNHGESVEWDEVERKHREVHPQYE